MTRKKLMTEFEPGHGFTKEDWDEVMDHPEATDEELAEFRPFAEVCPDLAASIARDRERAQGAAREAAQPAPAAPKRPVPLRLDPDVLEKFRATGPGWQDRVNDLLRAAKV